MKISPQKKKGCGSEGRTYEQKTKEKRALNSRDNKRERRRRGER
jgi:hypothetical protein